MSTIKVNKIENTSTTDGGISIDNSGHVTVDGSNFPTAGPLSNRNLIINGAMNVAQRGTSSTTSGYETVDRWKVAWGQGAVTQTQESLTTGAPYDEGFRYFVRAQNTTASTAANSFRQLTQNFEGQDIATSGWDYTSSTSYITLSYWVRSSVAQDYEVVVQTMDGTSRAYSFPFTLAADTWTKITETIPGSATNQIDNDNGLGLNVNIIPYYGTDYTSSSNADRTWRDRTASDDYAPDMTSTWANTTNATFDLTGVQLEVGSVATPFEHRSYGDELYSCQRYYQEIVAGRRNATHFGFSDANGRVTVNFPLAREPRTNISHDTQGTVTRTGVVRVKDGFPSSSANNNDAIDFFNNISNSLLLGLSTTASSVNEGSVYRVLIGSSDGQTIFTVDNEL